MAAGLGFKDFTTGEVLTAADVDGYLMQGIWVFASAAARDAAVTSPQEGNFAFLKDTNTTTYYTGSAWTNLDTTGMVNPMTTTGDTIYSSSGSTPARLGIGSTGQVLTVSGGVPTWATPAGGSTFSGCSLTGNTSTSVANNTTTLINWNTEEFDTNGYHDNTTNNTRITIPSGKAGKYLISGFIIFSNNTSGYRRLVVKKNGTDIREIGANTPTTNSFAAIVCSLIVDCAVGDYIEWAAYQTSGSTLNVELGGANSVFQASLIGA